MPAIRNEASVENCRDSNRWLSTVDLPNTKSLEYTCVVCGAQLIAVETTGNPFFPFASPAHPAVAGKQYWPSIREVMP